MTDLGTDVITEDKTDRELDDGGDHDRFAHYVKKSAILPSTIEGTPLEALCGKKVVQVSAGGVHSMVLTESGEVYSFGNDDEGRIGHGDREGLQNLDGHVRGGEVGLR